jgi:Gnt-I system low-affinity gluconate transporter
MAEATLAVGLTPVVASFSLAALVRIAQGSATVAMLTAAGLVAPIAVTLGVGQADLALMTIAIAAGATVASHVNDSGFWLVSKYFNLSLSQTLRTWSVASTLVGLTGFAIVLLISAITNLA